MVHIAWGKHALVFILRCHLGHVLLLLKKVDENLDQNFDISIAIESRSKSKEIQTLLMIVPLIT